MRAPRRFLTSMIILMLPAAAAAQTPQQELAQAYFFRGSFSEHSGDLEKAWAFYSRALATDPDDAEILFALARTTFDMGRLDDAKAYASRIKDDPVTGSRATLILAELEYRSGRLKEAAELFEKVKDDERVPSFEVHKFLARVYLEMEKPDRARSTLEEARLIEPHDLYVNYRLGFIYAEAGDTEKAIESFRRAVDANPSVPNPHLALASMLLAKGDREGAKESFASAVRLDPSNRSAVMDLSDLYYEDGQYEEGAALLESLRDSGKIDENGRLSLGRFYYRLGRDEEALETFKDIMTRTGENASILRVVSEIELDMGRLASAEASLRRLVDIEPDNFTNYVGLLLISFDLAGEPAGPGEEASISEAEGRYFLKQAVRYIDEESAVNNYVVGTVYRKTGDDERALHFLLEAEKLDPGDRQTVLELAALFEDMGQYGRAIDRVKVLHDSDPEDPSLSNFYGYLLAQDNRDLDLAERLLRSALEKEPDNGYFLDSLGWIMYRQGRYDKALEYLLRAVDTVGDDAVVWEHLGDTYVKLSRFDEAEQAYSRSIGIDPDKPVVQGKLEKARKAGLDDAQ